MNPKSHKIYIENIAEEIGVHPELVDRLISFYYAKVRMNLSDLTYPKIYLQGLGTFCIRKHKLEGAIKRNKDMLGNIEKQTYKGYERHLPIKDKLHKMKAVLKVMNELQEEKKDFKKKK